MRNYYTSKDKGANRKVLSVIVIMLLSIVFSAVFMFASALLIANTGISEKIISLIAVLANVILAISFTATLVLKTKIKPIFCSFVAFVVMFLLKLITNLALSVPITLSGKGIIMLGVSFFFCIAGALIFVNIKK